MNLSELIFWSATIVVGLTGTYNIEDIQRAVWRAQARIVYESRTETWGSPKFLVNKSRRINVNPGRTQEGN